MRVRLIAALGLPLMLIACGESQPAKPRQAIVVRSEAQDQLHKLDDMNRDIALKRAIHASGFRCKRVTKSGYVQEHGNLSMWTANCDERIDWAIFAGPDGSAQVRPCADLAQLGLPACEIRPAAIRPA
jgi:hypothetical protein